MSARAARAFAGAVLLGALACGGEGDEGAASEAREAPVIEAAPAAAASDAEASAGDVITESAVEPETDGEDGRIAELLDLEPEGAGLDALIRAAREDPDPSARETAVIALGDSEDARALDALIAATEDGSSRVVLAAIDQLSWFDDRRAQDAIRRLAESPDPEIAGAAQEEIEE